MTDRDYERKRNRLIPHAEACANEKCGKVSRGDRENWSRDWTLTFLKKMDELAREMGLIK